MATTLQFKRYSTATLSSMAGLQGELIVDLDKDTITIHDGVTVGGTPLATEGSLSLKQDIIVSGTDIKTLNNIDILGAGNISIGINELTDGTITTPASGEFLIYDGTNWANTVHTVNTNSITDMNTTGATSGQVLKYNGTDWVPADDIDNTLTLGAESITALSDVDTATAAPLFGQVLKWDNSNWVPEDDVDTHLLLSGSSIGALGDVNITNTIPVEGYVLKYIGTEWVPQPDTDTTLTLNTISIDAMQDVDTTTTTPNPSELLGWDGNNWVPTPVTPPSIAALDDVGDVDLVTTVPSNGDGLMFDGVNWVTADGTKTGTVGIEPTTLYKLVIFNGGVALTSLGQVNFYTDTAWTNIVSGIGATVTASPIAAAGITADLLTTNALVSYNQSVLQEITFELASSVLIQSYEIVAHTLGQGDEPTDFELQYSIDGGATWSGTSAEAGLVWTLAETKQFPISTTTYPINPNNGQLFFNETTSTLMTFNGVNWIKAATSPKHTVNLQTGTAYTLTPYDNGRIVAINNAAPIVLTIPAGLGDGFNCEIVQAGLGAITLTGSGATVNNIAALSTTSGQFGIVSMIALSADTFLIQGDLV